MDAEATKYQACDSANKISELDLLNAYTLFGDNVDYDTFSGIAINSKLLPSFIVMDSFVSVEKTFTNEGNGLIKNGLVGYWLGIPVIVTNNGTYDGSANECKTYFIKKGALGYVKQEDVNVEVEREAKLLCNDIVVSDLYATKVMDTDGIVIIRKTLPTP